MAKKGKRTLQDYPRPSVAVDTAVLTVLPPERTGRGDDRGELAVLQVRRTGGHKRGEWSLLGTFLHEGELLAGSVARSLREKAGLGDDVVPRQLRVFDAVERDTRGRVLSVAHKVWVPHARLAPVVEAADGGLRLVPVGEVGPMPFDHPEIVAEAVAQGRAEYAKRADPGRLLPGSFTLHELWVVHDAVAGHFDSTEDAFRLRAVRLLEPSPEPPRKLDVGRPAKLYRRR
ncbi:ADP-ribose pyrophosphatase YjhB, NUDIX family [Geodermatophilus pulveris]|uniref:ADP-ribose pyrophosphatase YjhB, NUDIX family n=1 Tax=Geodermatophilus pulveris TaxID=1564159 RepID=A0A239HG47_9ACTN|nr:NUDIX domain-containing protein [Geodermatophilus pulveris]SNS79813.1 ADP-ribose pyrophosphatase YjhB, NUDIX family [Geodermatophilus pulveris]